MVTVRKSRQQYLEFDAQRFQQGGRTAYSLILDLGTLDSVLPENVNTKGINEANRKFHPAHSDRIADYVYDKDDWVLGAIILGIDPDAVEFIAYEAEDGQSSQSLGFIRIPLDGASSSIRILDGQHRRMAIHTVRNRLRHEIREEKDKASSSADNGRLARLKSKSDDLDNMSIPIDLFEETNIRILRRMFSDLAQTRNIDAATKTRFDDRDPFNRAAVELVERDRSELLAGRVEMERTTPLRRSDDLLAINQLSRCLKVLKYGYGGRASRARILEAEDQYEELIDLGILWADDFLPSCREEYEALCSIELEDGFVAKNRTNHLAYSVTVLQMLAGCYHVWTELRRPWEDLASWIREADFERHSPYSIFRLTGMLSTGEPPTLISRRQEVKAAIEYIIEQASQA